MEFSGLFKAILSKKLNNTKDTVNKEDRLISFRLTQENLPVRIRPTTWGTNPNLKNINTATFKMNILTAIKQLLGMTDLREEDRLKKILNLNLKEIWAIPMKKLHIRKEECHNRTINIKMKVLDEKMPTKVQQNGSQKMRKKMAMSSEKDRKKEASLKKKEIFILEAKRPSKTHKKGKRLTKAKLFMVKAIISLNSWRTTRRLGQTLDLSWLYKQKTCDWLD